MLRIKKQNIGKISLFVTVIIATFSCKKESTWWDANFTGPIAKTNLTISNLVADSTLVADPDSALRISYSSDVFNYSIDSLVQIPDTVLKYTYLLPSGSFTFAPGQTIFSTPSTDNQFNVNNVSLTYAKVKTGVIKLEVENSVAEPTVFQYVLTNSILNGTAFAINEQIAGGSISNPGKVVKYYTVDGMELNLTGINADKFNTVTIQSAVKIASNANAGSINAGEGLVASISFVNIIPQHAIGYLGNEVIDVGPDTIAFDFHGGLQADYFALQNATVNLKITNGLGVDLSASSVKLTSLNSSNGNSVTLSGSGVSSHYNLNRATYTGNSPSPVNSYVKNIPLNSSNSNIKTFLENLPDKIIYQTSAQVNPLGNVSSNNDFVYYGYGFSAGIEVDIPLAFADTNLRFSDTTDFNMELITQAKNINYGELVLRAENGYPFDARIQAYMLDAGSAVIDSLFITPNTALAGNVDASLKVTSSRLSLLHIPLDQQKIEKIKNAKKIIFKIVMNTVSQPQIVKIYSNYAMGLVLTADINYAVNKK